MLIKHYDLDIFTPACSPGSERFAALARLAGDISDVLPYLNATLRGAIYTHAAHALTWADREHYVAFHPFEIAVSNVEDREAAKQALENLIALVNQTWERRAELTPDYETHQRPTLMAVYKQMPMTNCKQCGEPTCYTFAVKLAASHKRIADCPPLFEPQHADQLAALRAIVVEAPPN